MKLLAAVLLGGAALAAAHVSHEAESDEFRAFKRELRSNAHSGMAKCSQQLVEDGVHARAVARRQATVEKYRQKVQVRDTTSVLDTNHHSNARVKPGTPHRVLFNNTNTCVLNPEGETGPYYVPGEHIRSNVREKQPGVHIVLEAQFVDVETCKPISGLWWDLWNCNSTGVYAGVVENGNGNIDDASNINATFLRGIQRSDWDGVVTFESIFPGHYSGRTTHHHMVVHLNATVLPNSTITSGSVAHIGQAFWDQDLIYKVEATYPYNTNNITITTNAEDRVFSDETENTTSDPVFEYVYLGHKVEEGIFGWITIAINTSASYDPNYSFVYTSSGGVAESGGGSAVGGGGGNITVSGGGTPTGAMPSASLASRAFDGVLEME